jgi:hypothetical protein
MVEVKMKRSDGMADRLAKKHGLHKEAERSLGRFEFVQVTYDCLRSDKDVYLANYDFEERCWALLDGSLWSDIVIG